MQAPAQPAALAVRVWLLLCLLILVPLWDLPALGRPWLLGAAWLLMAGAIVWALWQVTRGAAVARVFVGFAVLYWALAFPVAINPFDDNTAYLVLARDFVLDLERTAQPLSERRMFSVGGSYVLQGLVLENLGPRLLGLIEPALGLALMVLVVLARPGQATSRSVGLLLGLIALLPFAAGKVLVNTASTFVLAAFTLALLELGRDAVDNRLQGRPSVLLLALLPLVAATLRPTTAPFNLLVATSLGLYLGWTRRVHLGVLVLAAAAALGALAAALVPYHRFTGAWLYPLLGRGTHITAQGHEITASLGVTDHLRHLVEACATDPLCWLNALLFLVVMARTVPGALRCWWALLAVAYVGFVVMMGVATGGLAASRYTFPVSVSLSLSLLSAALAPLESRLASITGPSAQRFHLAWAGGLAALMVMAYLLLGEGVAARRLRFHQVDAAAQADVQSVQALVQSQGAATAKTLLVNTGYERFLVAGLQGRYLLMDQPGMLSPWLATEPRTADYAAGLRQYLHAQGINRIVLTSCNCAELVAPRASSGWQGLMALGEARNQAALCALVGDFVPTQVGRFTVLMRP